MLVRDKYDGRADKVTNEDRKRIKSGEPLDYIIGWKPFLNCRIDLSLKPFIPRPETEFWVEKAIVELRDAHVRRDSSNPLARPDMLPRRRKAEFGNISGRTLPRAPLRVLDLFCGSGCIGVSFLKRLPGARVDFADADARYLKQARKNVTLNNIPLRRAKFIRSDVFSNVRGTYDVIVANPPYIAVSARRRVQREVLRFEPPGALFGGKDGMRHVRKLIAGLRAHLRPGGACWMEFGEGQKRKIEKELRKAKLMGIFHKDQYGRWRYVRISRTHFKTSF